MSNLFYDLPPELQTMIYEFDPTFHKLFRNVLQHIYPQVIYSHVEYYFIYDPQKKISYVLDNLNVPDYLSIRFNFDDAMFSEWIQTHDAVKLDPVILHMCLSLESFEDKMNI